MHNFTSLNQLAIEASLEGSYQKAIALNLKILKLKKKYLPALNRLGKCYFLLNDFVKAKKYYQFALQADRFNSIAKRNLKMIIKTDNQKNGLVGKDGSSHASYCYEFIEIPGKTKLVSLLKLNDISKLCHLKPGQSVELHYQKRSIRIYTQNCYIGCVADDLACRLLSLVKKGNCYSAYIQSVTDHKVFIFIKEVTQSVKNKNVVSFPFNLNINDSEMPFTTSSSSSFNDN